MRRIQIMIIGPQGAGKTTVSNFIKDMMENTKFKVDKQSEKQHEFVEVFSVEFE